MVFMVKLYLNMDDDACGEDDVLNYCENANVT
jgi:hypothetical protein